MFVLTKGFSTMYECYSVMQYYKHHYICRLKILLAGVVIVHFINSVLDMIIMRHGKNLNKR